MPGVPSPSPIPVTLVDDPSWLDISTQILIPLASLLVAALAIWFAQRSQKRKDELEAAEKVREDRAQFAGRLRSYSRSIRDRKPRSLFEYSDEWSDVIASSPDDMGRTLVTWIGEEYGALEHAYRAFPEHPDYPQSVINLQGEVEQRIRLWQHEGELIDQKSFGRQNWPEIRSGEPK